MGFGFFLVRKSWTLASKVKTFLKCRWRFVETKSIPNGLWVFLKKVISLASLYKLKQLSIRISEKYYFTATTNKNTYKMSNNLINCICPRCEYDLLHCWICSIIGDHTWALSRLCPFKVFKGCHPQIFLGPRLCHFCTKIFHHAGLCFNEVLLNIFWDSHIVYCDVLLLPFEIGT